MNDDTIGCIVAILVAVGLGWWLFDKYEIREREPEPSSAAESPIRPTGSIYVTKVDGGSVWRVDADSVSGGRNSRHFWLTSDHSNDKTVAARETVYLYRTDCETGAFRTLKAVQYDKDGKLVESWAPGTFTDKDDYATPGSNLAAATKIACQPGFDIPVP